MGDTSAGNVYRGICIYGNEVMQGLVRFAKVAEGDFYR